jgi:uncharacterized protein
MIHTKRQITDKILIEQIFKNAKICRIGLCKDGKPYVVPVAFGNDDQHIYFHSGMEEGMKYEFMTANNQVCFELEDDVSVVTDEKEPCKWDISYLSIIGFGTVEEVLDKNSKIHALTQIMHHYSNRTWSFPDNILNITRVWAVKIDSITGRKSKDREI